MVRAKDFVIFRAGTWNGETYTEADLDNMVASFNKDQPPHIIIGHSSDYKGRTRIPSFGQILGGLKRVGTDLVAMGVEFNEKLAHWIKEGFYNERSVELSKDNKRILALGMLGAAPPAVEGMAPMDEALTDIAMEYSDERAENVKSVEFAKPQKITLDELSALFTQDTFEQCAENCQKFMTALGSLMEADEPDTNAVQNAVYDLQNDLQTTLGIHAAAQSKVDAVKESFATKMSQMAKKLFTKHKEEQVVDTAKEKEYVDKITGLEAQVAEFSAKEKAAEDARKAAETAAADEKIRGEIKIFCETAKTEGKWIPAFDEAKLPEKMFAMAKAGIDYKEFFKVPVVPMGIQPGIDANPDTKTDVRPDVIRQASQYVKDHPKEFAGLNESDATNRAVYLQQTGKIKFTGK